MRALLERWRSDMLNATKARHITPDKHGNWTVTDQLALTLIFTVRPFPYVKPMLTHCTSAVQARVLALSAMSWQSLTCLQGSSFARLAIPLLEIHTFPCSGPLKEGMHAGCER